MNAGGFGLILDAEALQAVHSTWSLCPHQEGTFLPPVLMCPTVGSCINHRAHCALFITHCPTYLCLLSATPTP